MEIKNKDIEISKYFNITQQSEDEQITRFGYFASVPRLLDVLCTIPLSGLELKATFNVCKQDGSVVKTYEKYQKISYDTSNQNIIITADNELDVEIGSIVKTIFKWKYTPQIYKIIDNKKIVLENISTRLPEYTDFIIEYIPTNGSIVKTPSNDWIITKPTENTEVTSDEINVVANNILNNLIDTEIKYTRKIIASRLNAPIVENMCGANILRHTESNMELDANLILRFKAITYCGISTKNNTSITAADILALTNINSIEIVKSNLCINKHRIINNVTLADGQYLVYAYPVYMDKLNSIIIDGGVSALNSFGINGEPKELDIINEYGATIKYYVYVIKNPMSLKNSRVEFI